MNFDFVAGEILLVDKEVSWTSFDAVKSIRGTLQKAHNLRRFKVGHAGTLDPLATGLLLICTGKATKKIDSLQAQEKVYTGKIFLGATTPSSDLETEVDQKFPIDHITEKDVLLCAKEFEGDHEQTPPVFSAIKIDGKRAYEYARKNEEVKMKSRKVYIHHFKITNIDFPEVEFEIKCSKGTYIRSIARDMGSKLNSGAYLSLLRRTMIGDYSVDDALKVSQVKELIMQQEIVKKD
ncbi:MAG: tRNA pseudouridine(55) synthase TruB [Bacteroidales bacterium]|nr:tRNA pseudouridine(55) synthase TruB [Bacteroidales bacterium]